MKTHKTFNHGQDNERSNGDCFCDPVDGFFILQVDMKKYLIYSLATETEPTGRLTDIPEGLFHKLIIACASACAFNREDMEHRVRIADLELKSGEEFRQAGIGFKIIDKPKDEF